MSLLSLQLQRILKASAFTQNSSSINELPKILTTKNMVKKFRSAQREKLVLARVQLTIIWFMSTVRSMILTIFRISLSSAAKSIE